MSDVFEARLYISKETFESWGLENMQVGGTQSRLIHHLTPQRRETCRDSGESDELKILTLSTSTTTIWPRCFGSRKWMQYVEYYVGMCRSGDSSMVGPDGPGN